MPVKPAYDPLLKKALWTAQKGPMAKLLGGATGVGSALDACATAYDKLTADECAPKLSSFKGLADLQMKALDAETKIQRLQKLALAAQTAAAAAATKLKPIPLGGKEAGTYAANVAIRAGALAKALTALETEVKRAYEALEHDLAKEGAKKAEDAKHAGRLKAIQALFDPAISAIHTVQKVGDDDFEGAFKSIEKAVPLVKALAIKASEYKDDPQAASLVKILLPSVSARTKDEWVNNPSKLKPAVAVKTRAADLNRHTTQLHAHFKIKAG